MQALKNVDARLARRAVGTYSLVTGAGSCRGDFCLFAWLNVSSGRLPQSPVPFWPLIWWLEAISQRQMHG